MAADKDNGVLSDTEGGEKSAREQLKKANIHDPNAKQVDSDIEDAPAPTSAADVPATNETTEQRGRLQRKRSFEEVEPEPSESAAAAPSKLHNRKRSRDSTAEEYALNNGQRKTSGERSRSGDEAGGNGAQSNGAVNTPRSTTPELTSNHGAAVEALASPKTKRSRLHSATADAEATIAESTGLSTSTALAEKTHASTAESKTDASRGCAGKIQPGSAFANTSSSSPFGALETSTSTFASSKFGALAGSSSSGFGALGQTTGGPGLSGGFGSGAQRPLATAYTGAAKASGSAFGGAPDKQSSFATAPSGSAFGSSASSFGRLGGASSGGFGGGLGGGAGFGGVGGGGLSSFASAKPAASLASSSKFGKPFGAAADDEDAEDGGDEEDDGVGFKSPLSQESDKQDERFYEQDIETGEEGEVIEMTCRAKLYNFAPGDGGKKEWRERGVGILRLNVQRPLHDDDDTKTTARLLMRADGSHRVLLNTPILPQIKFGQPDGSRPSGSYVYFMGTIDDKTELQLLQLKVSRRHMRDHGPLLIDSAR
jgi:Ran-binding protein 3